MVATTHYSLGFCRELTSFADHFRNRPFAYLQESANTHQWISSPSLSSFHLRPLLNQGVGGSSATYNSLSGRLLEKVDMEVGVALSSVPSSYMLTSAPRILKMVRRSHRFFPSAKPRMAKTRFSWSSYLTRYAQLVMVAKENAGLAGEELNISEEIEPVDQIKSRLYQAVNGVNRGIFGVTSAKKSEIEGLVKLLESQNPTPDPTTSLGKVTGCWKLLFSTITILGSKRTKLGLRDFISLGDFFQTIDVAKGKAANVIKFNVRGLNMLNGQLTIEASFKIASKSRVDISYDSSTITPDQLMNLFRKNYDILLGIFNPEGWFEITYVDDSLRIGRDDKGNIFILERSEDEP